MCMYVYICIHVYMCCTICTGVVCICIQCWQALYSYVAVNYARVYFSLIAHPQNTQGMPFVQVSVLWDSFTHTMQVLCTCYCTCCANVWYCRAASEGMAGQGLGIVGTESELKYLAVNLCWGVALEQESLVCMLLQSSLAGVQCSGQKSGLLA